MTARRDLHDICEIIRHASAEVTVPDRKELADFLRDCAVQPLSAKECATLTKAIIESGSVFEFSDLTPTTTVHSTGAPGSLTTILSPVLAAAAGFYVPVFSIASKVAGAIDSLSCIPGYNSKLSANRLREVLVETRLSHVGHGAGNLAPADRILWELREETGTKKVPELIAASLLSKQIASGSLHGTVDIRVGSSGNAGDDISQAIKAGMALVALGKELHVRVNCVLSDFEIPQWNRLGRLDTITSVWSVLTSPNTYQANPHIDLCKLVGACACHASDPSKPLSYWRQTVEDGLTSGRARSLFELSIEAHGAARGALDELTLKASRRVSLVIPAGGRIVDARKLSDVFRQLRELVQPNGDEVGLHIAEDSATLTVLVPSRREKLADEVERLVRASLREKIHKPFDSKVLLYDDTLL